ncbi:MAG: hypothetical protein KGI67_12635, partial [Pseudomonadota bacterium]|nr:hypothetical protein [Pseudomonadota bacterium]
GRGKGGEAGSRPEGQAPQGEARPPRAANPNGNANGNGNAKGKAQQRGKGQRQGGQGGQGQPGVAGEPQVRRSRYEDGGQPLDNANRSAASLASGRSERPGKGNFSGGGGRMRRGAAPLVVIDPNHAPAPSEIVAILQGKRPTATFEGIPEEDRRELVQNRGQAARAAAGGGGGGGGQPGGNAGGRRSGSRNSRPRGQGQPGQRAAGGNARPAAERPLHERFPGLPRDEE